MSEPIHIPNSLAAYTLVINFSLEKIDVEEELLDRFLVLAKPRIDTERYGLLQVKLMRFESRIRIYSLLKFKIIYRKK